MAVQDAAHRRTLADTAEARTIAPAAAPHHHDDHDDEHDHDHLFEWSEAVRIGLVAIAAAAVWFRVWEPFPAVSVIGVVGLLIGGWPILKEAFENIVERRMTMELSMTIAIVAAAAIGEFFTALVITLFVLVAEVLEGLTVGRGRKAIRDLLEFLPREVSVRRAGSISSVSAEELSVGDAILVEVVSADPARRRITLALAQKGVMQSERWLTPEDLAAMPASKPRRAPQTGQAHRRPPRESPPARPSRRGGRRGGGR